MCVCVCVCVCIVNDQASTAQMTADRSCVFSRVYTVLNARGTLFLDLQAKQEEVLEHFEAVARMVDELRVFSSNEHYSEHSTESLRYLAAFAERAEMHSRRYPAIDDKDRDAKRIEILTSAKVGPCPQ